MPCPWQREQHAPLPWGGPAGAWRHAPPTSGADLPVDAVCAGAGAAALLRARAPPTPGWTWASPVPGRACAPPDSDTGESFTLWSHGTVNPIRAGVSRGAEMEFKGTKVSIRTPQRGRHAKPSKRKRSLPALLELVYRDLRFR